MITMKNPCSRPEAVNAYVPEVQPLVFDFADIAETDAQSMSQVPLRQFLALPKLSDSLAKLHFQLAY